MTGASGRCSGPGILAGRMTTRQMVERVHAAAVVSGATRGLQGKHGLPRFRLRRRAAAARQAS